MSLVDLMIDTPHALGPFPIDDKELLFTGQRERQNREEMEVKNGGGAQDEETERGRTGKGQKRKRGESKYIEGGEEDMHKHIIQQKGERVNMKNLIRRTTF